MVGFVGPAWAIRVARKGLRRARRGACTSNLARFEKLGNLSAWDVRRESASTKKNLFAYQWINFCQNLQPSTILGGDQGAGGQLNWNCLHKMEERMACLCFHHNCFQFWSWLMVVWSHERCSKKEKVSAGKKTSLEKVKVPILATTKSFKCWNPY